MKKPCRAKKLVDTLATDSSKVKVEGLSDDQIQEIAQGSQTGLRSFCRGNCLDDAYEDGYQDMWVKVVEDPARFSKVRHLKTFSNHTVRNNALKVREKQKKLFKYQPKTLERNGLEIAEAESSIPARCLCSEEDKKQSEARRLRRMRKILAQLRSKYPKAVKLYSFCHMGKRHRTVKEAAAKFGMTEKAVGSEMRKLRVYVKKEHKIPQESPKPRH